MTTYRFSQDSAFRMDFPSGPPVPRSADLVRQVALYLLIAAAIETQSPAPVRNQNRIRPATGRRAFNLRFLEWNQDRPRSFGWPSSGDQRLDRVAAAKIEGRSRF